MPVEQRPVEIAEVGSFVEVAACGTAVVLTPISSITHGDTVTNFGGFSKFQELYERVRAIQVGEYEDTHQWCQKVVS
jgi:branched-chain amino acid aminotransferase